MADKKVSETWERPPATGGGRRRVFWLPSMRLDASERHPAVWAAILGGAGLGVVWGIAARIWMRLISTQPAFTLSGTAAILIITSLFGAWAGLAFVARRRGWSGWGHYAARSLAVIFFIPLGIAGGMPLMLTVLVATLGLTRQAVVGLWVVAALAILLRVGTDIGVPPIVPVIAAAAAVGLTAWNWIALRPRAEPRWLVLDTWLQRAGRTILLLLAAAGFVFVAQQVVAGKPGLLGLAYVFLYLLLLYPVFLALRVGLAPQASAAARAATQLESSTPG